MKRVVILGSTGSIGESTLKVVASLPDRFKVVGLSANNNLARLLAQARQFKVNNLALANETGYPELRKQADPHHKLFSGAEGVAALAALPEADIVICGLVGFAGLKPVMAALGAGHDVALATKEVLVAAGKLVMAEQQRNHARIIPLDSEHSAIFQCLQSNRFSTTCVRTTETPNCDKAESQICRLLLTASGGPFANMPVLDWRTVTPEMALAHPRWQMGPKVTIDSATMMNKGLEIIEANWLFNIPVANIDVLIHPECIVHSMVEFADGALLAQLGPPDMRFPIQYALTWPERINSNLPRLSVEQLTNLNFQKPDPQRFPCLKLALKAALKGDGFAVVLNAANEIAVTAFLAGRIGFDRIWQIVESTMAAHTPSEPENIEHIFEIDTWARHHAASLI